MKAWYLVYSKPQQERLALENLERQGYASYLPMIRNRRRIRGKYTSVIEPMFPRYLFVHLSDETDNWGPIRSTIGVANLVRFGARAARVPDSLIGAMLEREEDGVQIVVAPQAEPGDRVRIVEGVMAGYEAIFQAKTGKERVVLLLQLAEDKTARVQVGMDDIELAEPGWTSTHRGTR
ncbi:MAG: transcription/translation regulatory transformer protein RfaH [Gammaproteobacteria bacterium]|nr:transcription/translation regulatory transformer protein RfaH [Gammaproteobacteria bacterium]NIM73597.1 transcription/translation regulatory transformer protein RfaH [Gammaproteobacteria bacterium]NIN40250.1 transcription/translation regulatory transformer protein RfaH [Gammaproteobacteria bacterium]NIO25412.1 transcription/translation regulatory transformer protein RfaH [Gammaproteobacteria bacterium]NIO66090.1 transcription/translation regulatory transformer protein RfaH [Gammaproteobacter